MNLYHGSPTISIVLPAHNEARHLPSTITILSRYLEGLVEQYEILVVDDGSTDGTHLTLVEDNRVTLIRHPLRLGKGAALRTGITESAGIYVAYTDADLPVEPSSIGLAFQIVTENNATLAIGDRRHPGSIVIGNATRSRRVTSRIFNMFTRVVLLPEVRDTQCCMKMALGTSLRSIVRNVSTDGYSFDAELIYLAKKAGMTIAACPVVWRDIRAKLGPVESLLLLLRMMNDAWRVASRNGRVA
ncbi:glycosyltransferase [Micromonospora sp. NBC_01638]|uniref:glycosyltransferase n=1 Tax=Micromonospora sp. NBC_01638 TaxID=2975982 RepID=UPI00386BD07C|nr:glycosyltransferase [Micromonospora sp. NBC_01638]